MGMLVRRCPLVHRSDSTAQETVWHAIVPLSWQPERLWHSAVPVPGTMISLDERSFVPDRQIVLIR